MHIAEGFLPPVQAACWTAVAAPFVVHGAVAVVREVREHPDASMKAGNPAIAQALAASTLPFRDDPGGTPEWTRIDALTDPARWRDIADRYGRYIGTPHAAIGGVCAFQHYTGRLFQPIVAVWAADASILDLQWHHWWARIDADGATREVSLPGLPIGQHDGTPEELAARISEHIAPLVNAVCETTGIVERVALGGAAASLAGALAIAARGLPAVRRRDFRARAERVVAQMISGGDQQLVSLVDLDVETGPEAPAFSHDRHTCCLIRLSQANHECETCPHLSKAERRDRQRVSALRPPRVWIDLGSNGVPVLG